VGVRRERDRLTELRVADDNTINLGDEHLVWSRPLREERGADRRCRAGHKPKEPADRVPNLCDQYTQ